MISNMYNVNILLAQHFGLSNIESLDNLTWDEYEIYSNKLLDKLEGQ